MSKNLENVNQWLMLATNIGVLAGLILVGFQIKQNSEIASAQLVAGAFEAGMQMEMTLLGENPSLAVAKIQSDPGALTDEELIVVYEYLNWWFDLSSRFDVLQQEGLVPEGDWETYYITQARTVFGLNEITRDIWSSLKKENPEYPWIQIADEELNRLKTIGYTQTTRLERMRNARAKEQQKQAESPRD